MRKLLLALFIATTAFAGVARGQFCPGASPYVFTDVPASDAFCGYITWMAETGVTTGCQVIDANNRLYCPDDLVTRKQMAAFMKRQADAVMPLTCAPGQMMKWTGLVWACANDNVAAGTGTVTSIAAGTGLAGGTITTSGTIAADTAYLQRRVSTTCAVGSSIRAIAADGSVTCQADSNSGGTVTGVTAGTGLATVPAAGIVGAGSVGIANGGVGNQQLADNSVTFNKIAPGSVGAAQVNTSQIQLRLAALCPRGVPMIGVAVDGSPICDNPVRAIGSYATERISLAVRADGRPLLAHGVARSVYDCADVDCTSGAWLDVGFYGGFYYDMTMALRSDGRPVVAGGWTNQLLTICGDTTCTPGLQTQRTLDAGSLGVFSEITLRADNTPLVSYFEYNSGQTRLYVCGDPTCASGTVRNITGGPSFTPSGLKIRPNGSPVLALRNYFSSGHALYDCNDASCSSGATRTLGDGASIRFMLGLAVRADNRSIVVNSGPVMHDCADAACSSNTPRPFDTGAGVSASAAVVRGDGRPLLVYVTFSNAVKVFDCGDTACTSGVARVLDQIDGNVYYPDREIALALRPNGLPVVAYTHDLSSVRLLMCRTANCQ